MKNPINKGIFYYEISILMFVIMWKHDASYKPILQPSGLTIGPLYIWINKYWWCAIRERIRMDLLPIKHRIKSLLQLIIK